MAVLCRVWRWDAVVCYATYNGCRVCFGCSAGSVWHYLLIIYSKGRMLVQVVVVRSPKVLSGVLRRLFKIPKQNKE